MKLEDVIKLTQASIVTDVFSETRTLQFGFSSDLMSDVLTLDVDNVLLITGLSNIQLVRTAEMADISVILLARNKKSDKEMIQLANESKIVILETSFSIYRCSGILFANGLKPTY